MVLDASALLALLHNEPGATVVNDAPLDRNLPILTADKIWQKLKLNVDIQLFR